MVSAGCRLECHQPALPLEPCPCGVHAAPPFYRGPYEPSAVMALPRASLVREGGGNGSGRGTQMFGTFLTNVEHLSHSRLAPQAFRNCSSTRRVDVGSGTTKFAFVPRFVLVASGWLDRNSDFISPSRLQLAYRKDGSLKVLRSGEFGRVRGHACLLWCAAA